MLPHSAQTVRLSLGQSQVSCLCAKQRRARNSRCGRERRSRATTPHPSSRLNLKVRRVRRALVQRLRSDEVRWKAAWSSWVVNSVHAASNCAGSAVRRSANRGCHRYHRVIGTCRMRGGGAGNRGAPSPCLTRRDSHMAGWVCPALRILGCGSKHRRAPPYCRARRTPVQALGELPYGSQTTDIRRF